MLWLLQMRIQESAVASQLAAERKQREDAGRALARMERQFAQVRRTRKGELVELALPIQDLHSD